MYKPHLYVATPMYGGMCCGAYTQSIINLVTACNQNGIDVSFSFMFNESLIQRARNGLVHNALKTPFTHFMFIDSDIRFNAMDIISKNVRMQRILSSPHVASNSHAIR